MLLGECLISICLISGNMISRCIFCMQKCIYRKSIFLRFFFLEQTQLLILNVDSVSIFEALSSPLTVSTTLTHKNKATAKLF